MIYKGKGGLQYDLSATPLAAGGEGEIYNINGQPTLVAKLYKSGKTSLEKEKKLVKMVNEPPDKSVLSQIAWPQDVLYDTGGQFVGFIMPKMNINEDLNVIYEYGSAAKYPEMPWENRIIIAENLCAVLDCVHAAGHTCGDFNPKNISVNPKTGHIMFLDTDSYHIQDGVDTYRCDVGVPEYLPAEVQVKMRGGGTLATAKLPTFSHDTDNFALAIHIFQLLMNGVHPFACAIIPSQSSVVAPQPSDNIIKGEFPFIHNIPGVKIPAYAPRITVLPQELQDLFERAFIDGHFTPSNRPTPAEWHKALEYLRNELKPCNAVNHHQYYKALLTCPWCDVDNKFSQQFQSKSTLSQKTIKPPITPPPPPVNAPSRAHPTTSQYTKSSFLENIKQKFSRMHVGLRVVIVAVALVAGFGVIRAIITNGDISSPVGNFGGSVVDTALESSNKAYENGVQAMANRNYSQAITEFRLVIDRDKNYNNAQAKLNEAVGLYKNDTFDALTSLEASGAYKDIINKLNAALALVPADDEIASKLTHYTELMYAKDKEYVLERISEIDKDTKSSNDYKGGISALSALLNDYPAFNKEIEAEVDTITRALVTSQLAEIRNNAVSLNGYDEGITALKMLLNEYPEYSSFITEDISEYVTELVRGTTVSIDKSSLVLPRGESESLSYIANPTDAKNLELAWKSSNSSVATVDNRGQVTATGAGSAEILLTAIDGTVMATCNVSVSIIIAESFTSGTRLSNNWVKTSGDMWKFDGDNGYQISGNGIMVLNNVLPETQCDFTVEFEAQRKGFDMNLVTFCLGKNNDNKYGDVFGIIGKSWGGLFSPHIKYSEDKYDSQGLYYSGKTIAEMARSSFEGTTYILVKIQVKDSYVDIYMDGKYIASRELSMDKSAFAFVGLHEVYAYSIRNFSITID